MCLNKKFTKEEWNLNESLRISNEIERISNKSLQISYITNWNEFWRNLYEFETSSLRRMNGFWTNLYGFPTKLNEFRTDFQRNWTNSERISTDFQRNWMILKKPYIKKSVWTKFQRIFRNKNNENWTKFKNCFPLKRINIERNYNENFDYFWTEFERINFVENPFILRKPIVRFS